MTSIKQVASQLERSFSKWDFKKAIKMSDNEAKTRDYLVEPFFEMLGYQKMDNILHEFSLKLSPGHVKKIDMVITINRRSPIMLIECKKATSNLTKNHLNQLSTYFDNHRESKVGILTNGIIYEFYSLKWNDNKKLNNSPFLIFDINDFTKADLEEIAIFHYSQFDPKNILEISEEKYFLDDFNSGLTKTLFPANEQFIKLVFQNMDGKRMTPKINERITDLINSISLENSLEEIRYLEAKQSSSGVHTSADELKAYNTIKTMLAMTPLLKKNYKRIGYKDYRTQFKILIDDMPSKEICNLTLTKKIQKLSIKNKSFELKGISTVELSKYRKKLVDRALEII